MTVKSDLGASADTDFMGVTKHKYNRDGINVLW